MHYKMHFTGSSFHGRWVYVLVDRRPTVEQRPRYKGGHAKQRVADTFVSCSNVMLFRVVLFRVKVAQICNVAVALSVEVHALGQERPRVTFVSTMAFMALFSEMRAFNKHISGWRSLACAMAISPSWSLAGLRSTGKFDLFPNTDSRLLSGSYELECCAC